MALVTLCPGCGTTYKIYPEQLQAQNGLVRCGKCQIIFNGFATLITIDEAEIEYFPEPVDKDIISVDPDTSKENIEDAGTLRYEAEVTLTPSLRAEHVQNEPFESAQTEDSAGHVAPNKALLASTESTAPVSDFLSDSLLRSAPQHWGWKYGSIGLCVLLIVQAIHAFRADLAIQVPQARPYLEGYCAVLGCTVPLPKNIQLLSIVASDLQVRDPEYQPDMATLTAIIRNHAPHAQALPALKLYLTDIHNQVLASRILTAADYLSAEQKGKKAIQPNQEIIIQLYLDNSRLKSTGYRLQLLY